MKKFLFLLMGLFLAVGMKAAPPRYPEPYVTSQYDMIPLDFVQSNGSAISQLNATLSNSQPYLAQGAGVSQTAIVFPTSSASTNAIQADLRIPQNYQDRGKFIAIYSLSNVTSTTGALRCDVEINVSGSLTSTTVTQGTAVVVENAVAGSQLTRVELPNACSSLTNAPTYFANQQVHVFISRTTAGTAGLYLYDVIFEYRPYAEIMTWLGKLFHKPNLPC